MPRVTVEHPLIVGKDHANSEVFIISNLRSARAELKRPIQEAVASIAKMDRKPEDVTVTFALVDADFVRADVLMNEHEDRDKATQDEVAEAVRDVLRDYYARKGCTRVSVLVHPFDIKSNGASTWRAEA